MSTKDLWQFRSVQEYGDNTLPIYDLGQGATIRIDSFPYPVGHKIKDGFGNEIEAKGGDFVVSFGLPRDTANYALDGQCRIICSTQEFPRSSDLFDDTKESFTDKQFQLDVANRDSLLYRAVITGKPNSIVYVSVMYYSPLTDKWLTSPNHLMDRVIIRGDHGNYGQIMFDLMPRYMRKEDVNYGNALFKLLSTLGLAFDDFKAILENSKNTYVPSAVDAGKIPYIDTLLAWPTNFELREKLRRYETEQAVSLWKAKGSARALELVMQNTIGWDAEIFEGKDQIMRTGQLTPTVQPIDWVEGEIDEDSTLPADQQATGIWNEINSPYFGTWSPTTAGASSSPQNRNLVLPSNDSWQNVNGVLIRLTPTADSKTLLSSLALKKAKNIVPLFIPHYAQVFFTVQDLYIETIRVDLSVEFDDDFDTIYPSEALRLDFEVDTLNNSGACLFYTWGFNDTVLNSTDYRLSHNGINFTCEGNQSFEYDGPTYIPESFL
jgi:hypothetical protein